MNERVALRAFLAVSAAAGALTVASPALAQALAQTEPAPPPPAQVSAQGNAANASSSQDQGSVNAPSEGQIIVTAQRRRQVLIDVPQSISVISGESLERLQAKSFLDYAQLVPGLNVTQDNPGQSRLILRGINTGSVGSTVAVYVDDLPFGQSGSLANGAILAGDFDTFDVTRIEVLRGPQGTLYGANSLGGVLKFITALPDFGKFEFRAQAGGETVRGGGSGGLANAMVNLPLGDNLAFRASGFYHRTPGQVDAFGRTGSNIDDAESYGGRASLLFKPDDRFSVRLFAMAQKIAADSPSNFEADPATLVPVNPITGAPTGREQLRFEKIAEIHDIDYRLYSGTLDYDFGFADLTSITSYSTQKQNQISDISTNGARALANALYAPAAPNTIGLAFQNNASLKKFTQEVRLVSPSSTTFDWLIGGYYTHETTGLAQIFEPFTLATQTFIPRALVFGNQQLQEFVTANIDAKYREYAAYGSGTLHFGPNFDLTGGLRYSDNRQSSRQQVNQLGTGAPQFGKSSEGVLTWSLSPRFEFNKHAAIYARVAKGYRPGGPNFIPPGAAANFPTDFRSDTLVSYEAGIKAETADHVLSIDAAAFYIDWNNILILTSANSAAGPVGVNANGKRARTYGAEATVTLHPVRGLNIAVNGAYTNAKLRDDTTALGGLNLTGGLRGDELPFTPQWQGDISAEYEWTAGRNLRAFIGGDLHLQSDQKAGFSAAYRAAFGRQITLGGYSNVDLHAGADIGNFTVQVYVRNLFDSRGLVDAIYAPFSVPAALGGTGLPLAQATSIRPRTIGATVGIKF
jgi:iron complex outermembrane receptor protein